VGLPAAAEPPAGGRLGRMRCRHRWRRGAGGRRQIPAHHGRDGIVAPNAALATKLLHPRGVVVVRTGDEPRLPFADEAFDLVSSRHPSTCGGTRLPGAAAGGTYLAQQIGPATMSELVEHFIGPQPQKWAELHPDVQRAGAQAAGLRIVDMQMERQQAEFFDVGSVIYFLRKVIWAVPDFTVDRYRDKLRALHERIEADGPFVTHAVRVLVEARKPD